MPEDERTAPRPGPIRRVNDWARQDVWQVELGGVPTFRRWWTRTSRVVLIACSGFVRDRCTRHAMALTTITIFALPPFLAFVFSIAKGFGVYRTLKEGTIDTFLDVNFGADESSQVRQAVDQIFAYVEDTPLGSVAALGLLVILYAVFKLLGAVELTLNDIWGVQRARRFVRKVSDYLAIVAVTPVLLLSGAGMTAYLDRRVAELTEEEPAAVARAEDELPQPGEGAVQLEAPLGARRSPLLGLVSTLTIVLGMAFVIFTLPNTAVKLWPAVFGGVLAGLLWQLLQLGSVQVQGWLSDKNAIYSSLAAIPMLMIWIYLSWTILLVGAEAACAVQTEPAVASLARTGRVDQRLREVLAPRLAVRVTAAFLQGQPAPTEEVLSTELGLAPRAVVEVLERLVAAGLLVRATIEDDEGYLPGRDPETILLSDVLAALRREEGGRPPRPRSALDEAVDAARSALEAELEGSSNNRSLRALAEPSGAADDERAAA